ncbi:MAG: 50S ribosomal protein L11 methyltransferase [Gemmatimonadetes bacterium]|nr:50S ribosomal protein L11 methyltransferase [Gemmatimonadota bacterium]
MSWFAIEVAPDEARRDAVAAWLVAQTGQAIEERADGTVVSFALSVSDADRLTDALQAEFGLAATRRELPEEDWTTKWREGLGPRSVGRVTLVPTWVPYQGKDGETVITMDPETAFGSGEHGSTRAALTLLDRWVKEGDTVIDLGTGSGILAIAAALLGAEKVIGVELDAEAIPVASANADRNHVGEMIEFLEADAGTVTALLGPADIVVSNILRLVNVSLLPAIHRATRRGGTAIFSGMEKSEATDFRAPLLAAGFEILAEVTDDGWWAVAAERT